MYLQTIQIYLTESYMKKIQISQFKKVHGVEAFEYVRKAISSNHFDGYPSHNSSININKVIVALPENEYKSKFEKWSSGYDFAVFDVG